ncbi:MAG: preprotein translocase subunit SecA, partial [Clostridia bacterium]|nr:preprotein translocase subunit SecA [Clostridia bacterium]
MGLFSKLFGTYSEKQIKKIVPIVDKIEELGPKFKEMTDAQMRATTDEFKQRLANGETLEDILPEAYALVREAADRVLGKRPFRVQLMCAILLHQGRVAEMKTGEGKTLVAVLPAYLNALTGKGVHIVTVNDYLADLGRDEMGRIHEFLGLTTGLVVHGQTREEKIKAYNCDITYGTNNEFGFDYLRDNMVIYKQDMCQRGHNFAIVDEVDSILIDEARTPLIISGAGQKSTEMYDKVDVFVKSLKKHVVKELDMKVLNDLVYVLNAEYYDLKEDDSGTELKTVNEIYSSFEDLTSRIDALKDAFYNDSMQIKSEMELTDRLLLDNAFLFEAGAKNGNKTNYLKIKVEARDYIVDEKARTVTLTKHGIEKAERYFGLNTDADQEYEDDFNDNLLTSPKNSELNHHIQIAIKAHGIMHRDTDYVIRDNQVIIVDTFTGRLMPGRRYNDGLHQAIEAKEHVKVQRENRTIATITFQNYFRMYSKLSGMTGTALSEEMEFREIYGLDVVEVPTNKPMIRKDHNDVVYRTKAGKDRAIIRQIKECRAKGQPVLVGTVSVEKSEMLSQKLKNEGIPHNVLNAKHHEREAEIVAQAGKLGAVTISTNMAGRGTDIMLGGNAEYLAKKELKKLGYEDEIIALATGSSQSVGEEVLEARRLFNEYYEKYKQEIAPEAERVREAGGLFIIGTERHESRRIDNQLRGRSGRQGDPGESRFYLSFEDDLMRLFGSDRILGLVSRMMQDEDIPIDAKILSGTIESSQKRIEAHNFQRRKNVLSYDDVMNQQRNTIYSQRADALGGVDLQDKIEKMIISTITNAVEEHTIGQPDTWELGELKNKYSGLICFPNDFENNETREQIKDILIERAIKLWKEKEEIFGFE